MVVFDRAYNYYQQFALWTEKQVYFVTRMKKNAVFEVIEVKRTHYRKKGQAKVLSEEIIELEYNPEDEQGKKNLKETRKLRLRRVRYQDDQNRYYEFLTNNFDIEAEEVAFLYKKRWGIELLFYVKQIVMQSWSKNSIVYKPFTSLLYTTALHNNITPGICAAGEAYYYFSPIQVP